MLKLHIKAAEVFDSQNNTFSYIKEQDITLEHSLVSLSKWESKWHVPFLNKESKPSAEMMTDYIRCMTITQNVDPLVFGVITASTEYMKIINEYIENPMTATWFNDERNKPQPSREIITAELIYYWMISFNIPIEFQKWHLNKLLTLIKVCNIKNSPPEKIPKHEWAKRQNELNNQRLRAMGKL